MKNHQLSRMKNVLKLVSCSVLLACSFSLFKSEAARAACGVVYEQ